MLPDELYQIMSLIGSVWLLVCIIGTSLLVVILLWIKIKEWVHVLKIYEQRKHIVIETVMKDANFWKEKRNESATGDGNTVSKR